MMKKYPILQDFKKNKGLLSGILKYRELNYIIPSEESSTFPTISFLVSFKNNAEIAPNIVIIADDKKTVLNETKLALIAIKYAACFKTFGSYELITE